MIFLFWVIGAVIGSFSLLFCMLAYEDATEYWLLFTLFWPLGLLVVALLACKKAYLAIKKILHNN